MRNICFRLLVFAAVFCPALPSFAGQQPQIKAGEEVIVTYAGSGEELRGHLLELSSTSLAILVNGQRVEVPIDQVLRIDGRKDSLKNGTIIGAAIMGGLSAFGCAFTDWASTCVTGLVFNTGIGAAIGAGIDALHKGRSPIYVKAAKSGAALQVKISW